MPKASCGITRTVCGLEIDMAQKDSVRAMRHNPVVGVMVSAQDDEGMQAFHANRLKRTPKVTAAQARDRGLTQHKLDELLSDES